MTSDPYTVFDDDPIWEDEAAASRPEPLRVVPSFGQASWIPTFYRGHLYRSRTEARWALFFDEVGISYRHEEQPYGVDGQGFLPDFRLTDRGIDVEVKGDDFVIDAIAHRRYQSYVDGIDRRLLIVIGWPEGAQREPDAWYGMLFLPRRRSMPAVFVECQDCHRVGVLAFVGGTEFDRTVWSDTSMCRCRNRGIVLVGPTINQAIATLCGYRWDESR